MRGLITLWHLHNFENKDKLQDPKYGYHSGVMSLSAIEDKNWLFSCGTEHYVMVWDLVVGKHVRMLQGHSQSLLGIRIIQGTKHIITGNVSGIFAVTCQHKKKIIIGADKVYFFDYEESQEENLADSKLCVAVLYNEVYFFYFYV